MAANFCVYYAIWAMLGTYLQKELGWTPAQVSVPVFWGNIITFLSCSLLGRHVGTDRAALGADDPLTIAMFIVPLYIRQTDRTAVLHSGFPAVHLLLRRQGCAEPRLAVGTLPDRGASHGVRVHLSPGRGLGAAVAPMLTYFAVTRAWASPSR